MTFRSPVVLWALVAVPVLFVFLLTREKARRRHANRFASERIRGRSNGLRTARPFVLTLALALGCVGLAGPQLGTIVETVRGTESNLILVLDTSMSMAAEDIGTSRLAASKALVRRILTESTGRVGLIVFESTTEVVAPLTEDHEAVATLVESIGAGETAEAGSDLAAALQASLDLMARAGEGPSAVVLISDGEHRGSDLEEVLALVRGKRIRVSTVLVGDEKGAMIPFDDGFLRDEQGTTVVTRADPRPLQRIADATEGRFFSNPFSLEEITAIIESVDQELVRAERERIVKIPRDRYQWPLGAAFVLFLVGSLMNRGAE